MQLYKLGAHTKTDLKAHVIWIPKYRKKVLTGEVAIRTRDILRYVLMDSWFTKPANICALREHLDVIGMLSKTPKVFAMSTTEENGT